MAYENVILIVIAAGIILFGAKKLPELARALGRAQSDYERARREAAQEIRQIKSGSNSEGSVGREKLEEIAETLGIDYSNKNDDELRAAIDAELNKNKEKAKA